MKIFITSFVFIFTLSVYGLNTPQVEDISKAIDCKTIKETNTSASTCFKKGERTSGMNKICTYSCVSGDKSITIKSHKLCPLTIKD